MYLTKTITKRSLYSISALMLLALTSSMLQSPQDIIIKGNFQQPVAAGEKVYLTLNLDGYGRNRAYLDSAVIENQSFEFKLDAEQAGEYKLVNSIKQPFRLYLESGVSYVTIAPVFMESSVRGNTTDSLIREYIASSQKPSDILGNHRADIVAKEEKGIALTEAMTQAFEAKHQQALAEAAAALDALVSRKDFTTTWALLKGGYENYDSGKLAEVYSELPQHVKESRYGRGYKALVDKLSALAIGAVAPDFEQNGVDDKPVRLSTFLNGKKLVLIDFWASWCGPCRQENPNVVRVYNKYKSQGFDIIAVSLDGNKESWLKGIKADGLPWLHVSDLGGWRNEVALQYDIKEVPQNFLLDAQGVILAKNLHGEELEKAVAKYSK